MNISLFYVCTTLTVGREKKEGKLNFPARIRTGVRAVWGPPVMGPPRPHNARDMGTGGPQISSVIGTGGPRITSDMGIL